MEGSSFINAFRMLKRKPASLLLLLPLHLAISLLIILLPNNVNSAGYYGSSAAAQEGLSVFLRLMGALGLEFVFYLLAGFLLIPPAMELLHDGAEGLETQPGWYARGLRKHWWKPVTLGAMETAALIFVGIFLYIFFIVAMFASFSGVMLAGNGDIGDNFEWPVLLLMLVFLLVALAILSFIKVVSAMLLPATADRGFGQAFKAIFSKTGFRKTMKVFGVYLLVDFIYLVVCMAIVFLYFLVRQLVVSMNTGMYNVAANPSIWILVLITAPYSLIVVFKYNYIFSVFQEIKLREKSIPAAALPVQDTQSANG